MSDFAFKPPLRPNPNDIRLPSASEKRQQAQAIADRAGDLLKMLDKIGK